MNLLGALAVPFAVGAAGWMSPAGSDLMRLLGAWSLTYLVHSTLLLAGAWAVSRLLAGRAPRAEEAMWRIALFAGFLTAGLQLGVPELSRAAAQLRPASPPATIVLANGPAARVEGGELRVPADPQPGRPLPLGLAAGATVLWAATAATGAGLLALAALALRRRLRDRREVSSPAARRELDDLLDRTGEAPVRLTETPSLAVPIALGVLRREICLPRRVVRGLGDRERRALLAHELAHHSRRDPAWLLLARLAETVGALQPLNRLARRRLTELAEWLADARAVRWTGDPEGLARCLAEVAAWRLPVAQARLAPGFATEGRRVVDRVRRLLARGTERGSRASLRWTRLGAGIAALTLVAFAPGVAPGSFGEASSPIERVGATPPAPVRAPAAAAPSAEPAPAARPAEAPRAVDPDRDRHPHELTPEERAELRRAVREARAAARAAQRDAQREAHRAAAAARAESLTDDEIERLAADAARAVDEAMAELPDEAELQAALERAFREARRDRPDLDAELRRAAEESRREVARALAEAREQMPDPEELARLQAEAHRTFEQGRRELDARQRQEIARLAEEMQRIQQEIAPRLRELERLGERIGREVESALEGLEDLDDLEVLEAPGDVPPPAPAAPPPPVGVSPRPAPAPRALPAPAPRPESLAPAPVPPPPGPR